VTASRRPATTAALPEERRLAAGPVLACVLVAGVSAYLSFAVAPGNVDVSWMLIICDRLLDGARLHVDIVEVNPPFSIWIYMPFALAERATRLPAEFWLSVGLAGFALLSVGLCARILGRTGAFGGRRAAWIAPVALFVVLYLFPRDFAQREQIGVVALLPWLALLAARDRTMEFRAGTSTERAIAGIGAAIFVMVKPPFGVLVLALPAFFLCLRRRSLRPVLTTETLLGAAITLACLAYLAMFHLAFFTDVMPMMREVYLPARMPLLDTLLLWPVAMLGLFCATAYAAARPSQLDRDAALLLLAAVGYLPAFLIMGKGWTYHALPFMMLGLLGFLVQIWKSPPLGAMPSFAKAGAATGILLAGLLGLSEQLPALDARRAGLDQAAAAIDGVIRRPSMASIATRLQPAHPLTRMVGGEFLSRYPGLWMIDNASALIDAAKDPERIRRLETLRDSFIAAAARDLENGRPDIIIDGGSRPTPGQQDVHDDPAIAKVLGGYRMLYQDEVVTVFIRSDVAPDASSASGKGLPPVL
jgi:hypothetical protein